MAEAAAAREQAEYDRAIAEKEARRRMIEAEEERERKQRRAQHDYDLAVLAAKKATAMAEAKLSAIEQVIREDERSGGPCQIASKGLDRKPRTEQWVRAQSSSDELPGRSDQIAQSREPAEPRDAPLILHQ